MSAPDRCEFIDRQQHGRCRSAASASCSALRDPASIGHGRLPTTTISG
jgi:hypothetical protein